MPAGSRGLTTGVQIDIYSDVVCPWCYIGARRLSAALAETAIAATVTWHAFQLDPHAPSDGQLVLAGLADKFGGQARAEQITQHTTEVAAGEGLDLRFDRAVAANTLEAHRLIWFAGNQGRQAELVEALHAAHFTHGLDVGSHADLTKIAVGIGLDETATRAFLDSDAGVPQVAADLAQARELGITSVPTFVFDGRYAVTGAQEASVLREVLVEVRRRADGAGTDYPEGTS